MAKKVSTSMVADDTAFPETEKHGKRKDADREVKKKVKKVLKWTGAILGIVSVGVVTFYTLNKFLSTDATTTSAPGSDASDQRIEQVIDELPTDKAVADSYYENETPQENSPETQEEINKNPHRNIDTDDDSVEENKIYKGEELTK